MNLLSAFEFFAVAGSGSYMIVLLSVLRSLKTLIVKFTRNVKCKLGQTMQVEIRENQGSSVLVFFVITLKQIKQESCMMIQLDRILALRCLGILFATLINVHNVSFKSQVIPPRILQLSRSWHGYFGLFGFCRWQAFKMTAIN